MKFEVSFILELLLLADLTTAVCLSDFLTDSSYNYPVPADWTIKLWHENLFTAQVMGIVLNDIFEQDVEFFSSDTVLNDVVSRIAGADLGFDSKDAVFWEVISEASLTELKNTSEFNNKVWSLPLGSGALADYYKIIHPGLFL